MTAPAGASLREARLRRRYRRAALLSGLLLLLGTIAVFVKQNPFAEPFQLKAQFSSAVQLTDGSQVRIAGIQIGSVSGISAGPDHSALVTMKIDPSGLPIHSDATLTVKPRLVLEGNGYIDVSPGSPATPALRSGATIPLRQTAITVQLDQVLDLFNTPAREAFQGAIGQLAAGFGGGAGHLSPGPGRVAEPPGYADLREAVRQFAGALPPVGQVAHALGGTEPNDLAHAIGSSGAVTDQLARDPAALADLVTSYNHVVGDLAAEDGPLAAGIAGFDQVLQVAPAPLRLIDAALPRLTSFANVLRPALAAAPATLNDTSRLLDQVRDTVRPGSLPALLDDLAPVLADLHPLEQRLATLFSYTTPVTDCINTHVVPTLNMKIQDGSNSTGDPVYLDLVHLFTGLTSFSSAVDGNGGDVRLGVTTGDRVVDTVFPGLGRVIGELPDVDGVRPVWLGFGVDPPFRPDQPCATQALPDLNIAAATGPVPEWASLAGTRPLSSLQRSSSKSGAAALSGRSAAIGSATTTGTTPGGAQPLPSQTTATMSTTPATATAPAAPTAPTTPTTTTPAAAPAASPLSSLLKHLL